MADKRINALANTASSTASDDFIAVDGTTNGTRKLNAFSPTFGGNATVTGTLTANSAITGPTLAPGVNTAAHYFTAYGATTSWPLRLSTIYDSNYVDQYLTLNGTLTGSRATPTFTGAAVGGSFIRSNGENSVLSVGTFLTGAGAAINTVAVFNPTNVTIPQTTASTTTSTGALVVGNGTSGGLGVGGSIVAGGNVTISGSNGYAVIGGRQWSFRANGSGGSPASGCVIRDDSAAADRLTIDINGNTSVLSTTASTSTSSGALVVSGGVGVAGSINTDGTLRFNANSSLPGAGSLGISSTYGLNFYASTGSSYDFSVFSAAGQSVLLVPTGTRNVSFSGTLTTVGNITSGAAITTSAPVGGAGLWELGTYSSTAPSATGYVTIEIGGTLYKLLASNV